MGVHVVDLRGQGRGHARHPVLADPTGRRRRQLTRVGRLVACFLGVWLCGLVLAGVGLLPGRLAPWALLVGSPSSAPRLERLEHSPQPKGAATRAPVAALGASVTSAPAGSRARQTVTSSYHSRRDRSPSRAHRYNGLTPPERGRVGPRRNSSSLRGRSTAPTRSEAGQSGTSKRAGTAGQAPAAGRYHVPGQSRTQRAEAPGRTKLTPGWEAARSGMQMAPSSSPPGQLAAPEDPEARGHEKAALTPP